MRIINHPNPEIAINEKRVEKHLVLRKVAKENLLLACYEGRFEEVPALTVKWQEHEDEVRIARDRLRKLFKS